MILLLWVKAATSLVQGGSSRELTRFGLAAMFKVHATVWEVSGIRFNRICDYHLIEFSNNLSLKLCKMMKYSLENTLKTKLSETTEGWREERPRQDTAPCRARGQASLWVLGHCPAHSPCNYGMCASPFLVETFLTRAFGLVIVESQLPNQGLNAWFPTVETQSPNHWTPGKSPGDFFNPL